MNTDTPKHQCPVCFYVVDVMSSVFEEATPSPGDVSVCVKCGTISVVQQDLTQVQVGPDFLAKLRIEDPKAFIEVMKVTAAIGSLNRRQ